MCWERQAATSQDYFGMVMLFRQTHCPSFQLNRKSFHCLRCDENLGCLQEYHSNQLFEVMSYINLFERLATNTPKNEAVVVTFYVHVSTSNTRSIQFNSYSQPMTHVVVERVAITVVDFHFILNNLG